MTNTTPLDALIATVVLPAGLVGLTVTGAVDAAWLGGWWYDALYAGAGAMPGQYHGKPCYTNPDGSVLSWNAHNTRWEMAATLGGTPRYIRDDPSLAGVYRAADGPLTLSVAIEPTYERMRYLDVSQRVISTATTVRDRNAPRWKSYAFQFSNFVACPDSENRLRSELIAEQRMLADVGYFGALWGSTAAAPGLTFGAWHAQFVASESVGTVETVSIAGGVLIKTVSTLTLINLEHTTT